MCKLCVEKGLPNCECAFNKEGLFQKDNWNCVTINVLRDIAEEFNLIKYGCDISLAVLDTPSVRINEEDSEPDGWCILSWYKQKGAISNAIFMSDEIEKPMTLDQANAIINLYKNKKQIN
jgi:hypothetical protein